MVRYDCIVKNRVHFLNEKGTLLYFRRVIGMDRKLVRQQINSSSISDLYGWRAHAVKCLNYYLTYIDEFEIEECKFVISHIDQRLKEINNQSTS